MPPRRRKPPRAGALTELPPLKIIRSILLLQLAYYVTAIVLILFTALVAGQKFSLALIFDWKSIRADNTIGWTLGLVWLLVGFISVIPLLLLISRSKLVPDFALTIHFVHLVVTTIYTRALPTNFLWWCLQAASSALMVTLGVWACRYRELQPINFGGSSAAGSSQKPANGSADPDDHLRGGRGRGRNRDDGPSYEMVGVGGGDDAV